MASSDPFLPRAVPWSTESSDAPDSLADLGDDELMSRVQTGDNAAFAILMRRHARIVLAVGRRVLRDQGAAEELVQDVFLLVYRRCHLFDPERGTFRAWLIQIAYNEAYRSRQRLRLRHIYEDQTVDHCLDVLDASATPEYHALVTQGEQRLRHAFQQLSPKQEQTLVLFFFDGYTLREISERLGESLENVRHYYYRALKALKETIRVPGTEDS